MPLCDYHTHTVFSDGADTPEAMVLEAIRRGMPELGISDHSYTAFDERYCIQKERRKVYYDTLCMLREKYAGKLRLRCGLEQDYWSEPPEEPYDYLIGSVHYIRSKNRYLPVDENADLLLESAERFFRGDMYALAEAYYSLVGGIAEKTGCRIIGHFDLITKFIERVPLFDTRHPRYVAAWQEAADRLLPYGCLFEINTGAVSRGYRTVPYPAKDILEYLRVHGARFILSGDSHSASSLAFGFDRFRDTQLPLSKLFED